MKVIAILIAKITLIVGRILKRGSSLPGYIASRIDPELIKKLQQPPNVVMVTGTNGKTSTTHFISAVMERASYKVAHNSEGANMPQGILTTLVEKSTMTGTVDADIAVLEVDEGFLKQVTSSIKPNYLVLTNLFEDQLDRFGDLNKLVEKIKEAIPKDTTLIINANDPLLVKMGMDLIENEKIYYGVDSFDQEGSSVSVACPACSETLHYNKAFYDKIGHYTCNCGFKTPSIDYLATDVDLENKTFNLNGFAYHTPYGSDYFIFNILAAVSYAKEMGITDTIIDKAIRDYKIGSGRMESITFGVHETILNLVKNPAGFNRSIAFIDKDTSEFNVFINVNNRPADGEDITWLEAVDYEPFKKEKLKKIYIHGEAAEHLYDAIIKAGIEPSKIERTTDIRNTITELKKSDIKTYFLTNYTAMEELSKTIESV